MNSTLSTLLQNPAVGVKGFVQLEQMPYKAINNSMTKHEMAAYLNAILYGGTGSTFECEVDEDYGFVKTMYAYPSPSTLPYKTGLTHGNKSKGLSEMLSIDEVLNFAASDTQTLRYPPSGSVNLTKIPSVDFFDLEGNPIPAPSHKVSGKQVKLNTVVVGALMAKYFTYRHTYTLTVPPRENDVENRYQTVFYAHWDGGVNLEVIKPATNADFDYENQVDCKARNISNMGTISSGGYKPPEGYAVDTEEAIDYCSQQVK